MRNGRPLTPLAAFLSAVRVRIVSDPGIVPYRFEVQGLEMTEGYFRAFLRDNVPGVTVEDVVRAILARQEKRGLHG